MESLIQGSTHKLYPRVNNLAKGAIDNEEH